MTRRLLAFTGSAPTVAALRALVARGGETITLTLDLGQGGVDGLQAVRAQALALGAARAHVVDVREAFARTCVLPALAAGAPADWAAALATLGRPLVAARLRDVAAIEEAAIEGDASLHDVDTSLLGRLVTDGRYRLTADPAQAPGTAADIALEFVDGVPLALNGIAMPLSELFDSLTTIAGRHGVGRVDGAEVPAGVVLAAALAAPPDPVVRLRLLAGRCTHVSVLVAHP